MKSASWKISEVLTIAALLLVACDGPTSSKSGSSSSTQAKAYTVAADQVTTSSAVLKGRVVMASSVAPDFKIGFQYSKSAGIMPSNSTTVKATVKATASDANYKFSAKITGLEPSTIYYFFSFVHQNGSDTYGETMSFTTEDIPIPAPEGAVDLGIVMTRTDGTKYNLYWAECNLCKDGFVSSPEKYGDYYAWGETDPKDNYSWSTYKFGNSSSGSFSKYNTQESYGSVDNITVLEIGPEGDDAASKILGGKWRMPTDEEWTALRTNCTWTWTSNYNDTGIAGRTVKSNVSGYTDKSIFLPAAGYWYDTNLDNAGSGGYYWSSSLTPALPEDAKCVFFGSGGVSRYSYRRYNGHSVRPVSE
ncbi:MAG: hypothetical protein IK045_00035 [Bacteroidales bacterium]|nr:hypothetical protein [Bacteroidales bacterium]